MNKHITQEHKLIRQARLTKGLSQQQVATLINIQIRQYQRLEYGESDVQTLGMRAGLSLCTVLEIDASLSKQCHTYNGKAILAYAAYFPSFSVTSPFSA